MLAYDPIRQLRLKIKKCIYQRKLEKKRLSTQESTRPSISSGSRTSLFIKSAIGKLKANFYEEEYSDYVSTDNDPDDQEEFEANVINVDRRSTVLLDKAYDL